MEYFSCVLQYRYSLFYIDEGNENKFHTLLIFLACRGNDYVLRNEP